MSQIAFKKNQILCFSNYYLLNISFLPCIREAALYDVTFFTNMALCKAVLFVTRHSKKSLLEDFTYFEFQWHQIVCITLLWWQFMI